MQLISNWKDAAKMTSVQLSGAAAILALADQYLPALQTVIPPAAYAVLFGIVAIARVVLQPSLAK